MIPKREYTAVIVTGSRDARYRDWAGVIEQALAGYRGHSRVLIVGECRGIDTIAMEVAEPRGWSVVEVPALWETQPRAGGPIRNRAMLNIGSILASQGYALEVLAFHPALEQARGTKDMVEQARKANVPVRLFVQDGEVT